MYGSLSTVDRPKGTCHALSKLSADGSAPQKCSLWTGANAASEDSQVQTVDMYRAMQMPKDGKDTWQFHSHLTASFLMVFVPQSSCLVSKDGDRSAKSITIRSWCAPNIGMWTIQLIRK